MRACLGLKAFLLKTCLLLLAVAIFATDRANAQSSLNPGYAAQDAQYSPSARAGREIWFFATAFNDRFYTYSYPQRLGAAIDWYQDSRGQEQARPLPGLGRDSRPGLLRSRRSELSGAEPRGDVRLPVVHGRRGASEVRRTRPAIAIPPATSRMRRSTQPRRTARSDQRQSPCDLLFGTSTGALGLRKFPNPRFDAEKWRKLNGSLGSWDAYGKFLSGDQGDGDSRTNRLFDGSIEPPFRIGMSCGACHISYDPAKPPADPSNPQVGEHRRPGRQSVQPHLADPRLGHVAACCSNGS